jgi:serine/threonine protein kinase/tetratricopeptide (TPR) repeat protein
MATLYKCSQGHFWEDLLDTPSLVDGEVRCPSCGKASLPCSGSSRTTNPFSLLSPLIPGPSTSPSKHQATRQVPSLAPTDPILDSKGSVATVVRPAISAPPPPSSHTVDFEVRGARIIERTTEVEVAPFAPSAALPSLDSCRVPLPPSVWESSPRMPDPMPEPSVKVAPNIPGYEILSELGRGGMGVVYKARQKGLNRLVALKMILAGSAADDRDRARFRTEAEAIARLQHPNIVQIFEVGDHENNAWFSLEYVDGGSLADRLKGQALPVHESARLIETLARAVHFAHQHGVVHRDLKPANVLLQREGQSESFADLDKSSSNSASALTAVSHFLPKVTDFGLAKTLDTEIHHTRSGMVVGTPGYMAPEQATGGQGICPATDTYALGVILYQMVTGKMPFVGDTPMDIMLKVTQEEPPRPRKWQPRLAADLETIILKCLEKDPRRRYSSALEFAEDLRRFLAHEPILARPVGQAERVVRWMKRHPAVSVLAAALVVGLLGFVGTYGLYSSREEARQTEERQAIEKALQEAKDAAALKAWERVHGLLAETADRVKKAERVSDLVEPVQELLQEAAGQLRSQKLYSAFTRARDDALFQATLASGTASRSHIEATKQKVQAALTTIGASPISVSVIPAYLTPEQQGEIKTGCFELLLVLADATAQRLDADNDAAAQSKAKEALAILATAQQLGFATHTYHQRCARFLELAGQQERAAEEKNRARELPPRNDMDHYLVGCESYREGRTKDAGKSFEQALRLRPNHFWARFYQALCHVREGQLIAARDNLTNCLGQHQEVRIYLLRGFVHGQLGELAEAEEDYNAAQKKLDQHDDAEMRYALYNNRAVTRLARNFVDEAKADLQAAIKLAPTQYQAYITLSQVYKQQGKLTSALDTLHAGLKEARQMYENKKLDANTLVTLGRLRYRLQIDAKNPLAALSELDSLLAIAGMEASQEAKVHRDRGHLLFRDKQFEEALAAYDRAVKLQKENIELHRWRGEVLMRLPQPRLQDAVDAFTRYIEGKGAPELNVFRGRALALMRLDRPEEAIGDYTRALGLIRSDQSNLKADLHLQRGQAYHASKAWELAAKDFEAALVPQANAQPSLLLAAYHGRALVRLQMRQPKLAAEDAEQMVKRAEGVAKPLYDAACVMAQVAGQIKTERDAAVETPVPRFQIRDQRRVHQDRAVELLAWAIDATPKEKRAEFWQATVREESALQPVVFHEGYMKLQKRYSPN